MKKIIDQTLRTLAFSNILFVIIFSPLFTACNLEEEPDPSQTAEVVTATFVVTTTALAIQDIMAAGLIVLGVAGTSHVYEARSENFAKILQQKTIQFKEYHSVSSLQAAVGNQVLMAAQGGEEFIQSAARGAIAYARGRATSGNGGCYVGSFGNDAYYLGDNPPPSLVKKVVVTAWAQSPRVANFIAYSVCQASSKIFLAGKKTSGCWYWRSGDTLDSVPFDDFREKNCAKVQVLGRNDKSTLIFEHMFAL